MRWWISGRHLWHTTDSPERSPETQAPQSSGNVAAHRPIEHNKQADEAIANEETVDFFDDPPAPAELFADGFDDLEWVDGTESELLKLEQAMSWLEEELDLDLEPVDGAVGNDFDQ